MAAIASCMCSSRGYLCFCHNVEEKEDTPWPGSLVRPLQLADAPVPPTASSVGRGGGMSSARNPGFDSDDDESDDAESDAGSSTDDGGDGARGDGDDHDAPAGPVTGPPARASTSSKKLIHKQSTDTSKKMSLNGVFRDLDLHDRVKNIAVNLTPESKISSQILHAAFVMSCVAADQFSLFPPGKVPKTRLGVFYPLVVAAAKIGRPALRRRAPARQIFTETLEAAEREVMGDMPPRLPRRNEDIVIEYWAKEYCTSLRLMMSGDEKHGIIGLLKKIMWYVFVTTAGVNVPANIAKAVNRALIERVLCITGQWNVDAKRVVAFQARSAGVEQVMNNQRTLAFMEVWTTKVYAEDRPTGPACQGGLVTLQDVKRHVTQFVRTTVQFRYQMGVLVSEIHAGLPEADRRRMEARAEAAAAARCADDNDDGFEHDDDEHDDDDDEHEDINIDLSAGTNDGDISLVATPGALARPGRVPKAVRFVPEASNRVIYSRFDKKVLGRLTNDPQERLSDFFDKAPVTERVGGPTWYAKLGATFMTNGYHIVFNFSSKTVLETFQNKSTQVHRIRSEIHKKNQVVIKESKAAAKTATERYEADKADVAARLLTGKEPGLGWVTVTDVSGDQHMQLAIVPSERPSQLCTRLRNECNWAIPLDDLQVVCVRATDGGLQRIQTSHGHDGAMQGICNGAHLFMDTNIHDR